MELAWTAVGDDAGVGTATLYDLRFSLTTIGDPAGAGEVDWSTVCTNTTLSTLNATRPNDCVVPVVNLSAPVPAGNAESRIVSGRINPSASPAFACDVNDVDISHTPCLVPNQAYYFALKVEDEVPNVSSMSNVVGGSNRTDGTATNAGLTALRNGFNLVSVPWALTTNTPTAVFGDDPVGSLSLFEWLSTGPATTDGCYSAYPIGSSTCIPGDEITLVVTGTGYFMNGGGGNDVVDAPADSAAVATGTNCGIANSYQVAVVEGWNIVGSPFEKPVDLDAVYVCAAGVARIFDDLDADATNDAASLGWVNF
ncbi:MAG TPA: hypothetical protein VLB09_00355, partial [Nitrospiria bacterium]|nr:hypothetical protein [Nitrospiria bacterium]